MRKFVEKALGFDIQAGIIRFHDEAGKVRRVRPASLEEQQMWELLTKPQSDWVGKQIAEEVQER